MGKWGGPFWIWIWAILHFLGESGHGFWGSWAQVWSSFLSPVFEQVLGASWEFTVHCRHRKWGSWGRAGETGCHLCLAWCPVAISDGWKNECVQSWSLITHPESTPVRAGFNQPGLNMSKCLQSVWWCFRSNETQCKEPGLDGVPFLLGRYKCNFE